MGFDVSVKSVDESYAIVLSGKIDISSHDQLLKVLYHVLSLQRKSVIIDFSATTFISSNGIGAIMEARSFTLEQGGHFILTGINPKIYKIFELIGIISEFTIYDTIEAAQVAIKSGQILTKSVF